MLKAESRSTLADIFKIDYQLWGLIEWQKHKLSANQYERLRLCSKEIHTIAKELTRGN
jgi:hypothetical protein